MILATKVERRLRQMAGLELGWRLHVAELGAWAVTAIALVMSYHAEVDLGWSLPTFQGWPAFLWPFLVDAMDVVCIVLWLEYKRLGISTWRVAIGAGAATMLMVLANIRSVWAFLGPEGTAVVMQAWAPASALWLWHALVVGRKPRGAPVDLSAIWQRAPWGALGGRAQPPAIGSEGPGPTPDVLPRDAAGIEEASGGAVASDAEMTPGPPPGHSRERDEPGDQDASEGATSAACVDDAPPQRRRRRSSRQVVRRLLRQRGAAVTVEDVMRAAGVERRQAQRLLREERQLHLVNDDAGAKEGAER